MEAGAALFPSARFGSLPHLAGGDGIGGFRNRLADFLSLPLGGAGRLVAYPQPSDSELGAMARVVAPSQTLRFASRSLGSGEKAPRTAFRTRLFHAIKGFRR